MSNTEKDVTNLQVDSKGTKEEKEADSLLLRESRSKGTKNSQLCRILITPVLATMFSEGPGHNRL